ncbi:40S ribosomal protein S2 [Psilocybe cubensis]|uniref:Small ribosomal subunit protein uS5 n=2 Tax=Psilocybe cubensis TaxID=181762 RepID=A0A8H7Y7W4_PSICU|nr:40S ribosomal protein S2 [Psilocybe cubensis]KAH9485353.1 40S ribosomal protein S2 [Psilocybe cubensis]
MADAARGRGGFGRGRGERGRGRRGPRRGGRKDEEKEWVPVTKLGRLVKDGKIKSMEEIYLFSLPVKEYQIIDFFLPKLKDEVMKIMPVQKQTRAGQRTRFKAFVAIGDSEGHVGLGVKCAKEVATAIRGAIILAKLSVIPVRRGYWGAALGEPHTVPSKVSGKVGSVMCRLIPAPRGTGIVAAPASKRLLQLAGVEDVYTQSKGSTATMGNFLKATFAAITKTYAFLTPDLWREIPLSKFPYDEHSAHLQLAGKKYRSQPELVFDKFDRASSLSLAQYNGSGRSFASRHSIALYPSVSTSSDFRVSRPIPAPLSNRRFSDIHGEASQCASSEQRQVGAAPYDRLPLGKRTRASHHSSRRYGTHFGDLCKEPSFQDIYSTAALSESDSEPDPSLYDISSADFPEPPPIGSPVIRRMRSSPWFLPERGLDKDFSDVQHWRSRVPEAADLGMRPKGNDPHRESPSTSDSLQIDTVDSASALSRRRATSSSINCARKLEPEDLEYIRPFTFQEFNPCESRADVSSGNLSSESGTLSDRTASRPIRFSKDFLSAAELKTNEHSTTALGRQETRPLTLGALPRIIRKVASMRSDNQKDIGGGENVNTSVRIGQKTLPKARSFRSILRALEGDKAFSRNSHVEGTHDIWPSASVPGDHLDPTQYYAQDSGRFEDFHRERVWRHHMSTPVSSAGASHNLGQQLHVACNDVIPERLDSTLSLRSEHKNTTSHNLVFAQDTKSFIDFTPEQSTKSKSGVKRERIKNMVARASNSFLGWSKRKTKGSGG